jgi:hypothetical protein
LARPDRAESAAVSTSVINKPFHFTTNHHQLIKEEEMDNRPYEET